MSNATTTSRSGLNFPLLVLWVVSIAVGAFGFWFLYAGNAAQADFYNSGGSDYLQFLNLQTQSTIGGFLLVAGVIGVFIALATHARNHAAAVIAANSTAMVEFFDDDLDLDDLDDDEFDGTYGTSTAAAAAAEPAAAVPVAADTAPAEATPADSAVAEDSAERTDAEPTADKPDDKPTDDSTRA